MKHRTRLSQEIAREEKIQWLLLSSQHLFAMFGATVLVPFMYTDSGNQEGYSMLYILSSEHIGHQMVINKIVGRNFFKKPGLHRSLIGDGVSTMFSSIIGGPPTTTYGENIGVLAITRIFSVWVIGGAGVLAIILGFIGKFTAVVQSIPTPVMGGSASRSSTAVTGAVHILHSPCST